MQDLDKKIRRVIWSRLVHPKTMPIPTRNVVSIIALCALLLSIIQLSSASERGKNKNSNPTAVEPLEYNQDQLVLMAVEGVIAPPVLRDPPYRVSPDGELGVYPGIGGITYNFRAGDSAVNIAADHVEPAVSIYNLGSRQNRNSPENVALNVLSCIGNEARVLTGDATGACGWVIGKHGGAEHVIVDFPDQVYEKLSIGDKIQIRAIGTGLKLQNIEGVTAMNLSPTLLDALAKAGTGVTVEGKLRIPVTHRIPAKIMGSGLGRNHVYKGDYDIQLFDEQVFKEHKLGTLRFGDIVALIDADNTFGRIYRTGAISVGVVVHSRSFTAGHGPGVVTLFSSKEGKIEPFIDSNANLTNLLKIR